jgi:hypothetical protein
MWPHAYLSRHQILKNANPQIARRSFTVLEQSAQKTGLGEVE